MLLVSLFGDASLRRELGFLYDGLLLELPIGASAADLTETALSWLEARGHIGPAFFEWLVEQRPQRAEEIREVAGAWASASQAPTEDPDLELGFDRLPAPSPELEAAQEALKRVKALRKQLALAGESVVPLDAELERLKAELGRLRFIAAIGAIERPPPTNRPFAAGFVLADRYELVEVAGRGGFARVWKAYDQKEERVVAVKVLREDLTGERGRVERFLRGAREMARLDHPGIVEVVGEPGEVEGRPWFAMEFLHGGDLAQAFAEGRMTWETALPCLLQIGAALQHAHEQGLLHRDVKPENILLDRDGQAKLTDFDLVRVGEATTRSTAQRAMGTFMYAAPETLRGEPSPDARVDVYGLGMTALFARCGGALPADELMFDRSGFFRRLVCAAQLKTLLEKALAYHAPARFESVRQFCAALDACRLPSETIPETHSSLPDDLTSRRHLSLELEISPRDVWEEQITVRLHLSLTPVSGPGRSATHTQHQPEEFKQELRDVVRKRLSEQRYHTLLFETADAERDLLPVLKEIAGRLGRAVHELYLVAPTIEIERSRPIRHRFPFQHRDARSAVEIRCDMLFELEDAGRWVKAGRPDIEAWAQRAAQQATEAVLFSIPYRKFLLGFEAQRATIRSRMAEAAERVGYQVRIFHTVSGLQVDALRESLFIRVESDFSTSDSSVEAPLLIDVEARIPQPDKIEILLAQDVPIPDEMRRRIEQVAAAVLRTASPEDVYLYFSTRQTTEADIRQRSEEDERPYAPLVGETLHTRLARVIRGDLDDVFGAKTLQISFRAKKNAITSAFRALHARQHPFNITVRVRSPDVIAIPLTGTLTVDAIDPMGWYTFVARQPTVDDLIETTRLFFQARFRHADPNELSHHELEDRAALALQARISELYGVVVHVRDLCWGPP